MSSGIEPQLIDWPNATSVGRWGYCPVVTEEFVADSDVNDEVDADSHVLNHESRPLCLPSHRVARIRQPEIQFGPYEDQRWQGTWYFTGKQWFRGLWAPIKKEWAFTSADVSSCAHQRRLKT